MMVRFNNSGSLHPGIAITGIQGRTVFSELAVCSMPVSNADKYKKRVEVEE